MVDGLIFLLEKVAIRWSSEPTSLDIVPGDVATLTNKPDKGANFGLVTNIPNFVPKNAFFKKTGS